MVLEDGTGEEEVYFVKGMGSILNFKQQNSGAMSSSNNRLVSQIYLNNIQSQSTAPTSACALMNDF